MKILHLSTFNRGGAAMIPRMMHEKCLQNGITSAWIVHRLDPETLMHVKALERNIWLEHLLERVRSITDPPLQTDPKYYFFNHNERRFHASARKILTTCGFKPDLICIYWMSGFINTATIRSLWKITGAKIRLFLTDMGYYTGGCHYSMECNGYQKGCRICPAILSKQTRRAARNLSTKGKNLKGLPIKFIASRGQSFEMANKASLLKPFDIVPNVFKVKSLSGHIAKTAARQQLGIKEDATVLLIGSIYLHEPRKGYSFLLKALQSLAASNTINTRKLEIALVGNKGRELINQLPFPTRHMGYLDFDKELPLAFSASDCFVSPSIADTGPYMINLSIYNACPVIAFPVGVAKYLVGEKKAGIMANDVNADCLFEAILRFLRLSESERLSLIRQCDKVAADDLEWDEEVFFNFFRL